ncbi:MAG: glycosyltransferase family 2 protein [Pseudomonadota bacterium]
MKFGIIIPTYNRPDIVVEAVDAVRAQTVDNWNLFITNDGSARDYSAFEASIKDDARIFYTRTPGNHGCNHARNVAIDAAIREGCDFLVFCDDEERLHPQCLEKAMEQIAAHPDVGWFISNTYGERKKSTREITAAGYYDWLDDYMYGEALQGDKVHVISTRALGDIRLDGRFRASNIWRFRMTLSTRTRIWGYPFGSKYIRYFDEGITKSISRYPKTWLELYSRFARHAYAIRIRPTEWRAWKYLLLELLKTPKRALYILTGKAGKRKKA